MLAPIAYSYICFESKIAFIVDHRRKKSPDPVRSPDLYYCHGFTRKHSRTNEHHRVRYRTVDTFSAIIPANPRKGRSRTIGDSSHLFPLCSRRYGDLPRRCAHCSRTLRLLSPPYSTLASPSPYCSHRGKPGETRGNNKDLGDGTAWVSERTRSYPLVPCRLYTVLYPSS